MKKRLVILAALTLFVGCAQVKEFFTTAPDQGIVVTNAYPGAALLVERRGIGGAPTRVALREAGKSCFVPASYYAESQIIIITVHAYTPDGSYLGSRSRSFSVSSARNLHYRNQFWDVKKNDFH